MTPAERKAFRSEQRRRQRAALAAREALAARGGVPSEDGDCGGTLEEVVTDERAGRPVQVRLGTLLEREYRQLYWVRRIDFLQLLRARLRTLPGR